MSELIPYICVADSRAAIEWYRDVFQATVQGKPYVMDDGREDVELVIGGSLLMMADPFRKWMWSRLTHPAVVPCRCICRCLTATRLPRRRYGAAPSWIAVPNPPVTADLPPSMIHSDIGG
jgi:hypothetical protein